MKILSVLILVLLFSCGKDDEGKKALMEQQRQEEIQRQALEAQLPERTLKYEYRDKESNCTTGEKTFNTKIQLCDELLKDENNQNCARELREEDYVYLYNC